jgi:hypothetical protein
MDGGYLIAFCSNGGLPFRLKSPEIFHRYWGKVHPNFLKGDFYIYVFQYRPHYISSSPFIMEDIHPRQIGESVTGDLSGEELLVITKFERP